jgi:cobalt-zinc-cadmium efflux system outer membrane protein
MNILAALTSMRAWSAFSYAMLLLGITGAAGCMSSSTAGDTRRVRDLTRVQEIARVSDVDVDPAAEEDARRILKRPLDADAAVRVALLNNREIRATLREMGIARGRLIQAGVLPNPVVEAELLPERNSEVELRVEYDITGAVLAPIRARAAEPDVEAARYRAAAAVIGLGYSVRVAFYRLQSAEQRLAIARRMLDAHAAARDAAKAIFDAGNVPELNFAGHDAAYERARITVAQLELEVATERERMQRKLGTQGRDTAWSVQGELPDAPESHHIPKDVETRALRASFELSETRHRLEGLARRSGIARTAGWIPDIAVDVHGLYGNPEEGTAEQDEWRFGGGVSVGVPLFNRGQGTATSLEAEHDALLERYYGSAVDVRSAARER